jgi:hypothetical protein
MTKEARRRPPKNKDDRGREDIFDTEMASSVSEISLWLICDAVLKVRGLPPESVKMFVESVDGRLPGLVKVPTDLERCDAALVQETVRCQLFGVECRIAARGYEKHTNILFLDAAAFFAGVAKAIKRNQLPAVFRS